MPYINQQMPLDLSSALISTIGYSRQRGKYSSIIIMFCTIREEYLDLLPFMDTKLINLRGLSQNRIFGPLPPPSLQMEQNSSTYDGLS